MKTLIIDDCRAHRALLGIYIKHFDTMGDIYDVGSHQAALAKLVDIEHIDIVFLDHDNKLNGFEFIPEIRRERPDIKIIIMTIERAENLYLLAKECKIDMVYKPMDKKDIKRYFD